MPRRTNFNIASQHSSPHHRSPAYHHLHDPSSSTSTHHQQQPLTSPRNITIIIILITTISLLSYSQLSTTATLSSSSSSALKACPNQGYILERHDHESDHGDICRSRQGDYQCPVDCATDSLGRPPFCYRMKRNEPCRAPRDDGEKAYRCDDHGGERGVCILAPPGEAVYASPTCDGRCGEKSSFRCGSDWDCSLSGTCRPDGTCLCDPWAEGRDCSYLRFQPVDRTKLGYLDARLSSWGGSVRYGSDGMYHMFVSEIACDKDDLKPTRCGLARWGTHSQIAHAVATDVAGPYERLGVVLGAEHHNPTVAVSPVDGTWNLYSIKGASGPIEVTVSDDDGYSWGDALVVSPDQNPAPVMHEDGTVSLFHRGDGASFPSPTCGDEYVGVQFCKSRRDVCEGKGGKTSVLDHTAEDPMVWIDHRGNYHMLMNALPYKCNPKVQQGGHAWSKDGRTWSNVRVGAFTAKIKMTDGSTITCERRERPQIVMNPERKGEPLALVSALTGCPARSFGSTYRGGQDCFTLVQMLER